MALKRLDNIGIVVDDLEATIDFFREVGLDLEGRATIEGFVVRLQPGWKRSRSDSGSLPTLSGQSPSNWVPWWAGGPRPTKLARGAR